jgi:hypothetical protein
MKKRASLLLGAVLLLASVAACAENSTGPDEIVSPAFDAAPDSSGVAGGGDGGRGTGWGGSGS